MAKITNYLLLILFTIMLSSCYHPDIQQGNNLSKKEVSQLKLGMTKVQVINLLGNPVLDDVFRNDRLVYIYTDLPNHGDFTERKCFYIFKMMFL